MKTATAPKLVISLSGLLVSIARDAVTLDYVRNALFYFGCSRQRVFEYEQTGGTEVQLAFRDKQQGFIVLGRLQEILLQAEADGRVIWRDANDPNTYLQLNELLYENGLKPLPFWDLPDSRRQAYNLPAVREMAAAAGIQVIGY